MTEIIKAIIKFPPFARKFLKLKKIKRTNPRNEIEIPAARKLIRLYIIALLNYSTYKLQQILF